MNKLLIVCGPTATGKTNLAFHLAKLFKGEVVSADSRQVYKGLDVGTGKDLPKNAKYINSDTKAGGYYLINGIKVWGYDLVGPTRKFSVAQYIDIVRLIIKDIWERNKLPILEGGTGLYINGVVDGIETSNIPRDEKLRKIYGAKDVDELYEILAHVDPVKAASMNESDKKNSRRLVRSIEIGLTQKKDPKDIKEFDSNSLWVGLKYSKEKLDKKIEARVRKRIAQGQEAEIKDLLDSGVTWKKQSMTSIGYKQWWKYFAKKANKEDVIGEWTRDEKRYTKRQMNWFRRNNRINWFDVGGANWQKNVEKLVSKWYKESDNAEKN